ncbi:PAS domain S-box protein [Actinoplanes sp. NPDC023936]|uniref:PAS domain S-box protein n=1 Tax=Actinoplanes sp. NPDC023936 TaxID=3154910 RepID=UPI0033F4B49C
MTSINHAVIDSPERLNETRKARIALRCMPMSVERIAKFTAHSVLAPMCQLTFVGELDYYFAGGYGMWPALASEGHAPLSHSLCKYAVSSDHPVLSENMLDDDDKRIRQHPLAVEYGARAFLAVPLRGATGRPVGALTVLDTVPRSWTAANLLKLCDVAELIGPVSTEPADTSLPASALDSASLLHSMQEAFVAITSDSVVVGYNRAAHELFGWAPEEVCGRSIEDTLCLGHEDQIMSELLSQSRFAPSQVRMRRRLRLRTRDGRLIEVSASLSMVRGSAGSLLSAFINQTDVGG